MMISLTGRGHGDILGTFTGVEMGSRIPAIHMKSRFYRYVAGGAAFYFYGQLVILEA
jgi:hypothetical protein